MKVVSLTRVRAVRADMNLPVENESQPNYGKPGLILVVILGIEAHENQVENCDPPAFAVGGCAPPHAYVIIRKKKLRDFGDNFSPVAYWV